MPRGGPGRLRRSGGRARNCLAARRLGRVRGDRSHPPPAAVRGRLPQDGERRERGGRVAGRLPQCESRGRAPERLAGPRELADRHRRQCGALREPPRRAPPPHRVARDGDRRAHARAVRNLGRARGPAAPPRTARARTHPARRRRVAARPVPPRDRALPRAGPRRRGHRDRARHERQHGQDAPRPRAGTPAEVARAPPARGGLPVNCTTFDEIVHAPADPAIRPHDAEPAYAHAAACPACAAKLEAARKFSAFLDGEGRAAVDAWSGYIAATRAASGTEDDDETRAPAPLRRLPSLGRLAAVAAASILVTAVALSFWNGPEVLAEGRVTELARGERAVASDGRELVAGGTAA